MYVSVSGYMSVCLFRFIKINFRLEELRFKSANSIDSEIFPSFFSCWKIANFPNAHTFFTREHFHVHFIFCCYRLVQCSFISLVFFNSDLFCCFFLLSSPFLHFSIFSIIQVFYFGKRAKSNMKKKDFRWKQMEI